MENTKNSTMTVISAAFIVVVVSYYIFQISFDGPLLKLFYPISLAILFGLTFFLFQKNNTLSRNREMDLKDKLTTVTDTLNDVQASLDDAVEKKTFEMSVINGSLNREIAERIQAENEGAKLQKRLQAILDSAGEGIFGINTSGNVTFVNQKAAALLGWVEEELVGKSHHALVHHTRKDGSIFKPEECPIYATYKDGLVHSESDDIFWTKSGHSFPVEYTSTPLLEGNSLTGAVVIFKDLSKDKKMQNLRDLILNSAGEGIFGLDENGNVTFMNRAASIMLGWKHDELIGKSHHELVHHSHGDGSRYMEKECPIYAAIKDGKVHFKSDDFFWSKDGNSFEVEYSATPIIEGSRISGAVVMFRDLNIFS